MQADTLDKFLEKYIEGYLFSDLASVKSQILPKHPGSAAYLMTGAICTGMEVLGYLLDESTANNTESFSFGHYCKNYMAGVDERYTVFGEIGRELIRNGITHAFTTKPNIGITRQGNRNMSHLVRRVSDNLIIINPDYLFEDFENSYRIYAAPRLKVGGDLHDRATLNYEQLRDTYTKHAERVLSSVGAKLQTWPTQQFSAYRPSIE